MKGHCLAAALLTGALGCGTIGPPVAAAEAGAVPRAPEAAAPDTAPPRPDARADGSAPDLGADGGNQAARSPGCGKPATGTSRYERRTIAIRAVDREYFLWLPRSYDPNRGYPIIFRWHGSGGNGTSGGLEIEAYSKEDAIIASPSGLGGRWSLDAAGPDVELFDTLLEQLGSELCLDTGRVFSYGFSAGGFLTNLLACIRPAVVRAAAPVEGAPAGAGCTGKVAAWITHGTPDTSVTLARGAAARDRYLQVDGCSTTTVPEAPAPCVRYQGCAEGYPVVWCVTDSPHNPQGPFTAPGAWAFFRSL
jgi:polyhydroxybutyrate depolymerase